MCLLRQPTIWWALVAAASSAHRWAWPRAGLEVHDLPPAAGWLRGRGGADVTPTSARVLDAPQRYAGGQGATPR
jgi:hypothetical protein